MRPARGSRRGTWAAATAIALAAVAACDGSDDGASTEGPATPPPGAVCATTYPAGPYGVQQGDTLADATFDILDETGASTTFSFHDAHVPCVAQPPILVVRVQAGFCGTCRWQAEHLDETLGTELRGRLTVTEAAFRH